MVKTQSELLDYCMNYFVSVNLKAYHDWQLELLLESFSINYMTNKLFVGISRGSCHRYPFIHHANSLKNGYIYENFGKQKGFEPLNELYQMNHLLMTGKMKTPLCVIKPHMVMRKPIEKLIKTLDARAFIFVQDPFFTFDQAVENCGEFWKDIDREKELYENGWFNLGKVFVLSGFPDWFVQKVIRIAETLIVNQIMKKKKVWSETIRLAWVMSIVESAKDLEIVPNFGLSAIMNDGTDSVFIDYEHGMPPDFSNSMFTFPPPKFISFGDPIEKISTCISTQNSHFISNVAKNILKRRKVKVK